MKHPVLALVIWIWLASTLAASAGRAAPPIVRATIAPSQPADSSTEPNETLEVSVTEAVQPSDLEPAIAWAEKDLAQAKAQNASLAVDTVVAAPGEDGLPDAQPAKKSIRQTAVDLFNRHYRVSFAVIRGIANSSVVSWGLILSSHVALAAALPVGIVAGSMSAGLQIFNQKVNAFLLKSKTPPGQLGRNAVINAIYMAITKFTSAVAHVQQDHTLAAAAGSVLKSSFLGTFAQGTWSLAFAKLANLQKQQHPGDATKIARNADLKALVNSMVSTGLSVASMLGAPVTDAAMLVMGTAGSAYYGYVTYKEHRWVKSHRQGELLACQENLSR